MKSNMQDKDKRYFFFINRRSGPLDFKGIVVWSYCLSLHGLDRTTTKSEISKTLHLNRQTLNAVLGKLVEYGLLDAKTKAPLKPSEKQAGWFHPIRDNGLPWHKQFGYFKLLLPADKRISMTDAAVWSKLRNLKGRRMSLRILAWELGLGRATVARSITTLRGHGLVTGHRKAVYDPAFWLDKPSMEANAKKPTLCETILSWYPKPFGSYYHDDTPLDRAVFKKRIGWVTKLLKDFGLGSNYQRKYFRNLWEKSNNPELFENFLVHARTVINMAVEKHQERHGGSPTYSFVKKICEAALFDLGASPDPINWEPVRERILFGESCSD